MALWYGHDLPSISSLAETQRRPSIVILASDGRTKLSTYGDMHGRMVKVKDLPPHVVQALLAIEDRRFYYHFGVDPLGLIRAVFVNMRAGHVVQGGSTLTQQLAKNFLQAEKRFDVNDRSFKRKIQEALMALWLERKFTKEQILTMYLNRVYFGSGTFGLEAAAQHYFDKSATELNVYESAVLAGLLKAPSRYSPASNPREAEMRAEQVLATMVEAGYLSEDAKEASLLMASQAQSNMYGSNIRYFCDLVVAQLQDTVGFDAQDLVVTTTLDARLQQIAESEASSLMTEYGEKYKAGQVALVSLTPEGAVKAMVGGTNYHKSQFNRATQALRQSGSIFKSFVYVLALEKGYTPDSPISDMPISLGTWNPKNFKYDAKGTITLTDALAYSVNTATIRLGKQFGPKAIADMANRMGVTDPQPRDLTLVLGTADTTLYHLTTAYTVLANGGRSVLPYTILSVKDVKGREIFKRQEGGGAQILDPSVVHGMNRMLSAAVRYGTGRNAAIDRPCAGKTGTSQKNRDAWFVGYTPDLVTGVWAGNDNNDSMNYLAGGSMATRLWKGFMSKAHEGWPVHDLEMGAPAYVPQEDIYDVPSDGERPLEDDRQTPEDSDPSLLDQLLDTLF